MDTRVQGSRPLPFQVFFAALLAPSFRQTNGRDKPRSRQATKGTNGCTRSGTPRKRSPCRIPGRSPPCAPTGHPKSAQGEALRFSVPQMEQARALKGRTTSVSGLLRALRVFACAPAPSVKSVKSVDAASPSPGELRGPKEIREISPLGHDPVTPPVIAFPPT